MSTSKTHPQKKKKSRRPSESERSGGFARIFKSSLFGALIGIGSAFALILIGALVCYSCDDPDALMLPTSLAAAYLSSLIGGFCASKKNGGGALICGSLSGVLVMLFFVICSFALRNTAEPIVGFPLSLLLRALTVAAGVVGGYLGTVKKARRGKRR